MPCPRCDVYIISRSQSEHDKMVNNIRNWLKNLNIRIFRETAGEMWFGGGLEL